MPDHFHILLDIQNGDVSTIMHKFKIKYSRHFRNNYGKGRVWQNRFWDHIIRDQNDFNRHVDYIHYNPVKHGFVNDPFLYTHSSLENYFRKGYYNREWGVDKSLRFNDDFGE